MNARTLACLLAVGLYPFPSGCATTVGQEFRDIMAHIDAKCRRDQQGPYYVAGIPNHPRTSECDILTLKPADPLATEEGRFAYAIQLPPPHDKPMVEYREGMSAESYFKELCEKAEGDIVLRTVEGVDGIKIMRPLPKQTSVPLWNEAEGPPPGYFVSATNGIYQYVDAVELIDNSATDTQLVHYAIDPKLPTKAPPWGVVRSRIDASKAHYGFTFRNSPLENRELGIKGRELIIVDLETNEILAFRRIFSKLSFITKHSAKAMQGTPCRLLPTQDQHNRFIARVLKPTSNSRGDKN